MGNSNTDEREIDDLADEIKAAKLADEPGWILAFKGVCYEFEEWRDGIAIMVRAREDRISSLEAALADTNARNLKWVRRHDDLEARAEAAEAALEAAEKELDRERSQERRMEWLLPYLGLEDIKDACRACFGFGTRIYGSSSTWRGGIGGQVVTPDVCDKCWGSGSQHRQGANLKRMEGEMRSLRAKLAAAEERER